MSQRVLLPRRLPNVAERRLREAGLEVLVLPGDAPASPAELARAATGVAGILATLAERIDEDLLKAAGPSLRVVANYAVGYDNIDLDACRRRGIRVTNTPDVLTDATADLAWTLLMAAARRVHEGERLVRSGQWTGWAPLQLLGVGVHRATLGIVGAGRIGTATAIRSRGFEMRVLYYHPRVNERLERELGATRVELDDLLRRSDFVSLHAPMRDGNRHLIDARRIALMKPTAVLINTARGALVDEAALVDALRQGRIFAAGLDVYEREPALTPGLADLPNVVLLPHLGSATVATRDSMARLAADNIVAVLEGRAPPTPVV